MCAFVVKTARKLLLLTLVLQILPGCYGDSRTSTAELPENVYACNQTSSGQKIKVEFSSSHVEHGN